MMKNTLSIQLHGNSVQVQKRRPALSITLWTLQVLVALVFLFAGSMKLLTPIEVLLAQMALPLPGWFVQFIGVAEVAGGLGLILPGLFRMQRRLTPLAATGLTIIMIGATVVTLLIGGGVGALFPLTIGLLCVCLIYGRRGWFL